jgi:stage IV sporulation protein FB
MRLGRAGCQSVIRRRYRSASCDRIGAARIRRLGSASIAMESGFLQLGKVRGIPISIHWSAFLLAVVIHRFRFEPAGWVAYLLLILCHELGHAAVARILKLHVYALKIHGLGGECTYSEARTPMGVALVAWGGVWAQLIIMLASASALYGLPRIAGIFPPAWLAAPLGDIGIDINLFMIAINLIPFRNLDGKRAWPLFRLLYLRLKYNQVANQLNRLSRTGAVSKSRPLSVVSSAKRGSIAAAGDAARRSRTKGSLRLVYGALDDSDGTLPKSDDQSAPSSSGRLKSIDKRTLN